MLVNFWMVAEIYSQEKHQFLRHYHNRMIRQRTLPSHSKPFTFACYFLDNLVKFLGIIILQAGLMTPHSGLKDFLIASPPQRMPLVANYY